MTLGHQHRQHSAHSEIPLLVRLDPWERFRKRMNTPMIDHLQVPKLVDTCLYQLGCNNNNLGLFANPQAREDKNGYFLGCGSFKRALVQRPKQEALSKTKSWNSTRDCS
eukprot:2775419-Amphidinium_carterae.2